MNILYRWRDEKIMKKNKVSLIVYNSMFSVMSLILVFISNFSLFPVFPYLKADISDMPVYLAAIFSGAYSGVSVLLTVSIIRALLFSSSGWIGAIMRLASVFLIIAIGASRRKPLPAKIIILSLGVILSVIFKLMLNYFCWLNFFSIPEITIKSMLYSVVLPYNLIKTVLSLSLALLLNSKLKKYIKKEVC